MSKARNRTILLIMPVLLLAILSTAAVGKTIYVDDDAAGANDGSSWENAYPYLQDALADASLAEKPIEIRVAQGVYKPDQGSGIMAGDSDAAFWLMNDVAMYGGYAGNGAPDFDQRDIDLYTSILSGELEDNNVEPNEFPDLFDDPNSKNVLIGNFTDETAVLDGFTIRGANLPGFRIHNKGVAGIGIESGSPTIVNCTFERNRNGISSDGDCIVTLSNCKFVNNKDGIDHGHEGRLSLTDCVFRHNSLSGITSSADELTLTDCLFVHNRGPAVSHTDGGNITLKNCEFRANTNSYRGGALKVNGETFTADNCIFSGNVAAYDGGAFAVSARRAVISNCLFTGNVAGQTGGAIDTHSIEYTTIRNCTFSGNTAKVGGSLFVNYMTKVTNCIFWNESSPVIRSRRIEPLISYCNVQGGWFGEGNIDIDPCFVEPGYWDTNGTPDDPNDDFWIDGDYHLNSQAGRWDSNSQSWVIDDITSPCIDAGDPNSPIGLEPFPNGGRVNMGAYGADEQAGKTYFGNPPCPAIIAGDINGDCVVDSEDLIIIESHWLMQGDDFVNKPPTVRLIEPQDGDQIAWPGTTTFRAEANDVDGQVDKVSFNLLREIENRSTVHLLSVSGETDGWQFEYAWRSDDAETATWTIWVEAIDNEGEKTASPPITVTLYRP